MTNGRWKMKYKRFEDLPVWREAYNMAMEVFKITKNFRDFNLKDQIRRAAISIPCNIAICHLLFASSVFASPKVIAILPFNNFHKKPHLEFVKNIVHEKFFTQLESSATHNSRLTTYDYIVIGVNSLEDAKKLYKLSRGKVPTVVLQGEYFMIRDRMALNVSLLNPEDGERISGTGELVRFKGYRYNNLPRMANFQKSLIEDMQEPLDKLIKGIRDLLEQGTNKTNESE